MNDSVWYVMTDMQRAYLARIQHKCVGIRGEELPSDRIINGWSIGAVNRKIYNELISKQLPVKKVYLTRNGVDTEIFKPVTNRIMDDRRLIVGWAGNPRQGLKRFELLRMIRNDFPLLLMTDYGHKFFVKDRSRDDMVKFYGRIDAFINVSIHEGMPQTILEAGATQLPVVTTNVGGMPEFVDEEWLVQADPPEATVEQMIDKLTILQDDPILRLEVGKKNLAKVVNEWSWVHRVADYERMFEGE